MNGAYYNEHDPFAAAWLRELIHAGAIPAGDVDERDIQLVQPADLAGYVQCHFFAGIGGWAYALELAGWPTDRPVWTGSCPCQPFSSATRGRATAADMWPEFRRLIVSARPRIVFGEQVASAVDWFDGVCDDLEAVGYEVGAAVLPACSVGADHVRERLYFACHTDRDRESGRAIHAEAPRMSRARGDAGDVVRPNGIPNVVAELRAFGNAIVPQLAAEVIGAFMDVKLVPSPEVSKPSTKAKG